MTTKELKALARKMRKELPYTNNNRVVKVLDETTKAGKAIIDRASQYDGRWLYQVYDKWSHKKQEAFDECENMAFNAGALSSFGICSHNTFGFTCSWVDDNVNAIWFMTPTTEYIVLCK